MSGKLDTRNESEYGGKSVKRLHHRPILIFLDRFELEHICWDPKDCELCLHRVKPGESLVEARSDTDVQIVRQMWV